MHDLGCQYPLLSLSGDPTPLPFGGFVGLQLLVWLNPEMDLFVPYKTPFGVTHTISLHNSVVTLHTCCVWVLCSVGGQEKINQGRCPGPGNRNISASSASKFLTVASKLNPSSRKTRFIVGCFPCVYPVFVSTYLPPDTFIFSIPEYVPDSPVHCL